MLGNISFTNVAPLVGHAVTATRALAGAVQRTSLATALKDICNLLVHQPASSPQGCRTSAAAAALQGDTDETSAGQDAASDLATRMLVVVAREQVLNPPVNRQGLLPKDQASLVMLNRTSYGLLVNSLTSKKVASLAPSIRSLEEFERQLDTVSALPPKWRNEPLNALGRSIRSLPDEDMLSAIGRFREAVEALPESHRNGLLGMYEASKKNHRTAFVEWEKEAVELVKSNIFGTDALLSSASRQALAAKYGLTDNRSRRFLEFCVIQGPLRAHLREGVPVDEALKTHGVGPGDYWEVFWDRSDFDRYAFENGPAKKDIERGTDYLEVAKKYGIEDYHVLQKMKACEANAYKSQNNWH